jgi:4'-phosphopantetheinyl transferase
VTAPADAVDLWATDPDAVRDAALLARYEAMLSDDERARLAPHAAGPVRRRHLVSRALLRSVLASPAGLAPERLVFTTTAHGKPELATAPERARVRFNLSHTDGAIVVAVAHTDHAIGVDVERLDRVVDARRLAERFFAPSERATLAALDEPARRDAFFTLWTLKEASLKARGVGIGAGRLDSLVVTLGRDGVLDATPSSWSLVVLELTELHRVAIALDTPARGGLTLDVRWTVPFADDERHAPARVIASTAIDRWP